MLPEQKLDALVTRHKAIESELSTQLAPETYVKLSREFAELDPVVDAVKAYRDVVAEIDGLDALLDDPKTDAEMRAMAEAEKPALEQKRAALEQQIKLALLPKDAMDERNVIIEIRAGTGGDEASLFAGDLFRMYERFAAKQGWKVEVVSASEGSMGGYKEIIAEISGRGAFAKLKFESGVHRVQRVPDTEASGRIHTSAATVAVLPEVEDVDIVINDADLKIDTLRAGGAGGQHVNKTESAIRVFHIPDRHRGEDAGGPLAAPQPRQGDGGAARPPLRPRAPEARRRARGRAARPGRLRRPLRAHPHLQFPAGPRQRPPHQPHALQAAADHRGRGARRDHRRAGDGASGGAAGGGVGVMAAVAADTAFSIAAARRQLAREFRDAGLDTPDLDARILVGHALALDHAALAAQAERRLTDGETDAIAALAQRRLDGEPVARIVGTKEFWGLPLALNADTLVPRPETETVVEAALAALSGARGRALRIADLDTGSGALLLALLSELPAARGVGTDISVAALSCARANAAALGLAGRASFVACDHGAALGGAALGGGFDLIVANPPYVASGDIAALAPEVRDFDPRAALDGGADGLAGLSRDRRRCAPAAGARRPAGARAWRRTARRRDVVNGCGRAHAGRMSQRLVWCATRPRHHGFGIVICAPKSRESAYRLHNSATQKSTWIVGQERLGFAQELTPRRQQEPAATLGEPQARRRESSSGRTSGSRFAFLGSRCFIGCAPPAMSRRGVAHDERWATPQRRLRARGCCFVTRNPKLRHAVPQFGSAFDPAGRGPCAASM